MRSWPALSKSLPITENPRGVICFRRRFARGARPKNTPWKTGKKCGSVSAISLMGNARMGATLRGGSSSQRRRVTDMRLIDADALKSELIAFYADSAELFNEVSCLVDSAKTAETVPVVLCRDCKFIIDRDDGTHGCYRHFVDECEPDDFCSYGERSTVDGLKPCPFCGSQNIGIVYTRANGIPSGDDGWRAEIKCKCGANMKFWALKKSWAKESITKAWNRRA